MKHYAYTVTIAPPTDPKHAGQIQVHIGEAPTRADAQTLAENKMAELDAPAHLIIGFAGPTFGTLDAIDIDDAREQIRARFTL